ncbi:MAG: HlyD family efflux transporter periplasmic adaptor subunit [Planctomycetota bacterium]|nr:MAG: HlyD family efflux transporter periplasmic adaptor subunit [Planctomycetota bacterium]
MPPSSSSAVPQCIPWRKRADLQSVPLEFDGRPAWGVKDPITLGYFELSEEAYFVLNHLDGQGTAETICTAFHQRFRPRTLSTEELRGFIGQLVSQGLVVAETSGHGRILVAQGEARNARRRWMKLTSLLAIRFRGFDPDRLLGAMLSGLGWIFSPWAMGFAGLLIVSAVTLIAVQFDELRARLPEAQALLTVPNLIWLSLLLAIVKVLHEFGHGLTCKKFGGECHELGVMLLVFTPTLYCNVSDIWMIRDKWRRIAVSAAGMGVEAVIAAACTLLWWFSAPGLFHSLCLNLMFLCGVSTFLFNGNPLLRYDGYFVLADWLEIPNLQQQASAAVRSQFSRWFCGFEEVGTAHSLSSQRRWGLLAYGIASSVYRIGLTYFIVWGVYHWLQPYGLGALAQILAVPTVVLLVVTPLTTAFAFFRSPKNRDRIHWFRFWLSTGCTLFALGWLFHTPWPRQISAGAIVDDDTAQRVYVTLAGTLVESATIGQHVHAGQIIAQLEEPRLLVAMTQLEGELHQHQLRLKHLEQRRVSEPNVAQNIPSLRETVRDLEQQVEQRRRDAERLILRAPQAGTVLPAASHHNVDAPGALPTWTGSPLDERNRGSYLQEGTTLCLIGPAQSQAAVLMVNQDDINLVRIGQRVRVQWNELQGIILEGEITELSALDLGTLSPEAVIRLQLPHRVDSRGGVRPVGTWYQARVQLDATEAPLLRGAAGEARIRVEPQSLWQRIMRWLSQTFSL